MSRDTEPMEVLATPDETGLKARKGTVFLEKASYRRRRLTDAVRLMPVVGLLLWAVPMLWSRGVTSTSSALLYVFGVWVVLVLGAAMLSRGMAAMSLAGGDGDDPDDQHGAGA